MSMRFLSRLCKNKPQPLFSRLYTSWLPVTGPLELWRFTAHRLQLATLPQPLCSSTISRCYSVAGSRDDFESSTIEAYDAELLVETIFEIDDNDHHRTLLLANNDDATLHDLQLCQSLDEIFQWHNTHEASIKHQHAVEWVLAVWDHVKTSNRSKQYTGKFLDLLGNSEFDRFVDTIGGHALAMNPDELTICFMYLSKLGVAMQHKTMNALLDAALRIMQNDDNDFSLTALSRFAVTVNSSKDLYTFFVCKDAIARVLNYLDCVNTFEGMRLVTICLNSLHQLVNNDILDTYERKVIELFDGATMTPEATKCLLKITQFLNYPHWSQKHPKLLRRLVLMLKDKIDQCHMKELEQIFKVFQSQLEPAELMPVITKQAQILFEKMPTAELLACTVMYALPDKRNLMTEYAKNYIYSKSLTLPSTLPTLFKILRILKISNVYICDGYWTKVLNEIRTNAGERETYILARHCHRYMHFNNNLGGTYRHKEFEKYVVSLLIEELQHGITGLIPSKFAKVAAFVLAYGHTPHHRRHFPDMIVDKMADMVDQFKIVDCLHLSRGIQIALQMRYKQYISVELSEQLLRIENILNACTQRHLEQPALSMGQLNSIFRAYINRQTQTRTHLFQQIIDKYEKIPYKLNSRMIREITFNLNASKYLIPSLCENLLQYVIDNKNYVMGDTVEKVLYCCYNLGFMPPNDDVLQCSIDIINRDFDYMNGLSIVQACLALTFYKSLPDNLVNRVFNIEFIKRLEDEIEMCYSKGTYPERVLNQVMQLNRAVCLDCPASNVPWFQQNYIEAQMSKKPMITNKFHIDIKNMLLSFFADQTLLKVDHVTPYGYRIDFVLHFDQNQRPVPVPKQDGIFDNITKVAILLLKIDAFCQNNRSHLRGQEILRERHLEMLGYRVVQVNYSEWNAMYMNVPGAKVTYLKNLLQIAT